MKLKEVDRTANVAWSPAALHPIHLAAGTAAQQLDATFSTKAVVELYTLNLAESGQEMELAGSIEVDSRLYKLVWGSFGMDSDNRSGLLIGGAEHGKLSIWDPVKILGGDENAQVHDFSKHSGQVIALDLNPFQANLLASGDSESEIYIWDLNKPEKPMTPGSKPQQQHAVNCVAWNKQVQHILGSSHGTNCVVWDLRKNEPIIKIRDSMSRIDCNMICWHPDVATQLCIASEDDHAPVIQLWDLRCATSPVRLLENHQRGVVSLSWCPHDSDLLLSSGKDNRILCWNPNSDVRSGEVLYEVPTSNRWSFDVQWCPRIPGVISGSSFDGHISVYSLMGGKPPTQPPSKVAEAFPSDPFSQPVPQPSSHEPPETMMKKAPKWLRRPVAASFAFGGKLICVENPKPSHGQVLAPVVTISQVVTETDLVDRSVLLEETIASGQYQSFCDSKIKASLNKADRDLWNFLKASFTNDPRSFYLELLEYNQNNAQNKVAHCLATTKPVLDNSTSGSKDGNILGDDDDEEEEELAEIANKMTGLDAFANSTDAVRSSPFDDISDPAIKASPATSLSIAVGSDCDGLMTEALLVANFAAAVDVALHHNRMAEAMILAIAGGAELLASTQSRVLKSIKSGVSQLLLSIVTRNFENIVSTCELSKWKEALAVILTYVDGNEFTRLCNLLGSRLENEGSGEYVDSAQLCFIVAGNINQLVASWNKNLAVGKSPQMLQDLIEKVMVLRKAVEASLGQREVTSEAFAEVLTDYAHLLAAQGCSLTALHYLGAANEPLIAILRDRLFHSLGQPPANVKVPQRPFKVVDVQSERPRQPVQQQPTHVQPRSRTSSANYTQPNAVPFQPLQPVSQAKQYPGIGNIYHENVNPSPVNQPFYPPQPVNPTPGSYGYSQPSVPAPTPAAKGPLSKYSSAAKPVASTVPSIPGMFDPYQQQQQQPQQASYPTDYATTHGQPVSSFGSQTPGAPLPTYVPPVATNAWNDPPSIIGSTKKSSTDHPGAPSYEGLLYNPLEYEEQLRHQQKLLEEQHHQQHQQQQQQQHISNQPQSNNISKSEPTARAAHQESHSAAVPPEHQVIQEVFGQLVELCQTRAYNVPIKKKLEDVRRKLDALYEKLNSGMLSDSTLTGLHQTVRAVQEYDYNAALAIVAQIVNVGSFTEIGVFMPGVKVLLQTAVQLQVFVQ